MDRFGKEESGRGINPQTDVVATSLNLLHVLVCSHVCIMASLWGNKSTHNAEIVCRKFTESKTNQVKVFTNINIDNLTTSF